MSKAWMGKAARNAAIAAECGAPGILANPDALDRLIIWRMGDPRYEFKANTKGDIPAMQRQWTIQLRADFTDADRNGAIDTMVNELAAHAFATLALMSDKGVKPHVVAFSDDSFKGHTELDWINMGDPLGDAKRAVQPKPTIVELANDDLENIMAAVRAIP